MRLYPNLNVLTHKTADCLTGDGVFADTDLVRIQKSGWLLVGATVTGTGDSLLTVPQINHQDGRTNNIPVAGAGVAPANGSFPMYKVWVEKGMTPRIMYDEVSDTAACFTGYFFAGRKHPVGINTPDILVVKQLAATIQNALVDTDLEDCPFPGYLLVWSSSDQVDSKIQVNQDSHQPGNYSLMPTVGAGLNVDIQQHAPLKTYVPATGNPTITVTEVTGMAALIVAAFYIDWSNVNQSMIRRMGL